MPAGILGEREEDSLVELGMANLQTVLALRLS